MKKIITVFILAAFVSCNPSEKSVKEFDMAKYCMDYIILVDPGNQTLFVFIDRKDIYKRFIIWKDLNYENSGYGYSYSIAPKAKEILRNGILPTADEAIDEANKKYSGGTSFWLSQFMPWGSDGQWMTTGAEIMNELCEKQNKSE